MNGKTIAILESRINMQMAELIRKSGGIPFSAPALAEIPDINIDQIKNEVEKWKDSPPDIFIFQTGVGAKALFSAINSLNISERFFTCLNRAKTVVRGPKPAAILRSYKIRIDMYAKQPYTSKEILDELNKYNLTGKKIIIQRYGESNDLLIKKLKEKGSVITELAAYKWALPDNSKPLIDLIDLLEQNKIDAAVFTSASQVNNLISLSRKNLKEDNLKKCLNKILIASIGPVCSAALLENKIHVDIEANPPKLGVLISALKEKLN